ncbi:MAG: BRO family protein [Candidatus Competibacter denitrificans]
MSTQLVPFSFESNEIRATQDEGGNPWFVAKDVAEALGISWSSATLNPIKAAWKGMMKFITPGGEQELAVICEQAVYKLAFRSRKPEAERFTDWIADVIAIIRKTGQYVHPRIPAESADTLIPSEQQLLHEIVKHKAHASVPAELMGKAIPEIWSCIHHKFHIAKYEQLPRTQLTNAILYVNQMELRTGKKAIPKEDPPKAIPAPDKYHYPLSYWQPLCPSERLTWVELVRAENRPLPNLLRRLREEGNDIAGAQIEYLVMRHLLETQSWLIGDIAHKVASFPARGLGLSISL